MTALAAPAPVRPAEMAQRVSWRVAPSGDYAVCALLRSGLPPQLERRDATGTTRYDVPHLGPTSQLVPTADGDVWMCHHRGGRHLLERLTPTGTAPVVESDAPGLALVDERLAVDHDEAGASRLLRIEPGALRPVATLDGHAVGAVRLDGNRVAVDLLASGRCAVVAVDTGTGAVEPFVSVSDRSEDHVVDYVPGANLLVIATDATGQVRLGVGRPGQTPVTFPPALAGDGPATHLATSADGSLVAVCFDVGARSQIRIVDTAGGSTPLSLPLSLPPLVVLGRGRFRNRELVVPVTTPDRPGTLLRVDLASGRHAFEDPAVPDVPACDVVRIPGPGGPLEAVTVGDPATAPAVVVALHGGPLSAWRAMFDPLLAELALAGVAVVAPNIRGSLGYSRAHAASIVDRWGGPDLEDVLAVGAAVAGLRDPAAARPVLLGISYGAWLGLLAAERAPGTWSGCAALAPFLSGARIEARGGPVAELVRRLGGGGSPDLRDGLGGLSAPLLVLHGEEDDVIPVEESRQLRTELGRRGHPCVVRLLPGLGHDLLASPCAAAVIDSVVAFCRDPRGHTTTNRGEEEST